MSSKKLRKLNILRKKNICVHQLEEVPTNAFQSSVRDNQTKFFLEARLVTLQTYSNEKYFWLLVWLKLRNRLHRYIYETKSARLFRNGIQELKPNGSQSLYVNSFLGTLHTPTSPLQDKFAVVGARYKQFKPWHAAWFQDPVWATSLATRTGVVHVWIGFENLSRKECVGTEVIILQGTQR